MRYLSVLPTLILSGLLFQQVANAQVLNSDFSNGLTDWTVLSSKTIIPLAARPFPPPNLTTIGGGNAQVSGNGVLLSSGFVPTAPDTLVSTGLNQRFSFKPATLPGAPQGVGRLQLLTSAKANLSFDAQFFSNERGTPMGIPAADYAGAMLNSTPVLLIDNKSTTIGNSHGFTSFSPVQHVSLDISSLFGTSASLLFFVSDTQDAVWNSGLLISGLHVQYMVQDVDAINSVYTSGLPTVLVQRQLLLNVAFNANRDVNARLFRLRSEIGEVTGAAGPSGDGKEAKEAKNEIVPPEKRWAFYATGNYGYRDVNNNDLTAGFTTDLFTATIGGEYKLTPSLTIGLAATRVESDNDLGALGSADIEGWSYDAYASYTTGHFYADLLYALGTYNHQINRHTDFLGGSATARPDSLTNSIQFNTGYNIPAGRFITGPLASLNWVHGEIDGYNEQQGGNADLSVPGQTVNSLTSEFGWQLSAPFHTSFGSVTPQIRASWVHEYLNTSSDVTVGLRNSPYYLVQDSSVTQVGNFTATGATSAPGDDYMSLGAGVAVALGDRAAIVLDWETRFFQAHSSAQNVSLTGEIKF